jgi:hypothetical protein
LPAAAFSNDAQHDLKQPCFAIGVSLKLVEGAPSGEQRLLHRVFGGAPITQQAAGHPKQAFGVHYRRALEFFFLGSVKSHGIAFK